MIASRASLLAVVVALAACVVQSDPQAEQDLRMRVPGRYVTQIDGQQAELFLNADGSASMGQVRGEWAIQLGTLMLYDGSNWTSAALDGAQLTVQTPNGPVVFQKVDGGGPAIAGAGVVAGGAAPAAGDPAAGDPAAGPAAAPPPSGDVDRRLIGCWEDYSNNGSQNGSGSFQRTMRLAADGSYAIRTSSFVSAGEFSSSSDDTEEGAWRSDGASLALQPNGGGGRQLTIRLDGGILWLGNAKYLPCN